jgi:hypothetical protein
MKALIIEIRGLIRSARQTVAKSVDLIQVLTNFEIGRRIVDHEQQGTARAGYGEGILKEISMALTDEFGRGFSLTNIKMMRKFYLTYQNRISQTASDFLPSTQKGQTLSDLLHMAETVSQKSNINAKMQIPSTLFTLSWSHYVFLIGIRNEEERRFYEIEAAEQH